MSKQLFGVNSSDDTVVFINPAHVIAIGTHQGYTFIQVSNGEDFNTKDALKAVVNRYQTAIKQAEGYLEILDLVARYTGE